MCGLKKNMYYAVVGCSILQCTSRLSFFQICYILNYSLCFFLSVIETHMFKSDSDCGFVYLLKLFVSSTFEVHTNLKLLSILGDFIFTK